MDNGGKFDDVNGHGNRELALGSGRTASAQSGTMMNGGSGSMWGDGHMSTFGGLWGPILLAVVVGLVVWLVMQQRK